MRIEELPEQARREIGMLRAVMVKAITTANPTGSVGEDLWRQLHGKLVDQFDTELGEEIYRSVREEVARGEILPDGTADSPAPFPTLDAPEVRSLGEFLTAPPLPRVGQPHLDYDLACHLAQAVLNWQGGYVWQGRSWIPIDEVAPDPDDPRGEIEVVDYTRGDDVVYRASHPEVGEVWHSDEAVAREMVRARLATVKG